MQNAVVSALFRAYFVDGRDIGEHSVLIDISNDIGLSRELIVRLLAGKNDHQHVIGQFSYGEESHVKKAIDAALESREAWANMPWEQRVSIFL